MSRALAACLLTAALLAAAPTIRAQSALPEGSDAAGEIDRYEPEATEFERQLQESARDLKVKHRLVNGLLLAFGGALVLFMLALLWMAVRGSKAARRSEAQVEELLAANRRAVELLEALVEKQSPKV
jgi:hypothetical protein